MMASRHVVGQQQNRGEAVPGKQKKMAAEDKNRRALGDIGNLVTVRGVDGKPLPEVSRPVTRSFCAKLLANAQAAENKKCPAPIVAEGAVPDPAKKGAEAEKKLKKKAVTKPKPAAAPKAAVSKAAAPKEVIEISPDTVEPKKEKLQEAKEKKAGDVSARKKAPTLTATLTARSKAACGLRNKPKVQVMDIDAADVENELAVVEYIEDMYTFYKLAENESQVHDYIDTQPEINTKMRAILIDWLIEVHNKFELNPETLYLTINLVDRYLEKKQSSRKELQLLGIGAMLIASKYEEIWAPEVNDFVCISDRTYTHVQVLAMEKRILGELEWYLTVPTPYVFLVRFIKASAPDLDVENMVYFLAELALMNYETSIYYCPSMIAASAVYAARCTLNKTPAWTETLKLYTGFSEPQLMDCAKLMAGYHSEAADHKLKVIFRKYSSSQKGAVALLPPAKSLLAV